MQKFRIRLLRIIFTIETDHSALATMVNSNNKKSKFTKIMRWELELNEFDFEICFRKDSQNIVADIISRSSLHKSSVIIAICETGLILKIYENRLLKPSIKRISWF